MLKGVFLFMSKKFLSRFKLDFWSVLPFLMIILGFIMILFWLPVWIWFVLFGILLIIVGFNIYG